jgi:hypothetical protein
MRSTSRSGPKWQGRSIAASISNPVSAAATWA